MQPAVLARLLALVAHTGERHIVFDPSLPEPLVLLPLSAYERLVGKTGSPAVPLPAAPPEPSWPEPVWAEPTPISPKNKGNMAGAGEPASAEEDRFYLEPIE